MRFDKKLFTMLSVSIGTLIINSCSPRQEKPGIDVRLNNYFSSVYNAVEPGGAVLVLKDTTIIFSKGYGIADIVTKEPITTKTLFNLGSISKTFVANGILILQEQGKLSVEDSLIKYFPNFKNKDIAQKVKIKHLLTHTSGLPDNRQVSKDTVFFLTANDAQNWYPITQTDTLEFEPGSKYNYSNPAFNGLALIIEQVSGKKWQDFIKENILTPSGMTTTTITDGPHPSSGVSHAYNRIHGQWTEDDFGEEPTFCASGNGGVWSSVEELVKYELALRNTTFLTKASIDDSRAIKKFVNWSHTKPEDRGWSWQVLNEHGQSTAEHTGSQGGFTANYVCFPEKRILFVVLNNTPFDVDLFREKVITLMAEEKWFE